MHSHNETLNFTFNIQRVLLGLWKHVSSGFLLEANMIGMYESTTPPIGWFLCDGNNNTPDMRDYFITASSQVNQGSSTGDNTFTATHASTPNVHGHCITSNTSTGGQYNKHLSQAQAHAHTLSFTDADYIPSYYSLAFIMFGG